MEEGLNLIAQNEGVGRNEILRVLFQSQKTCKWIRVLDTY
jgi:hypothetical protein